MDRKEGNGYKNFRAAIKSRLESAQEGKPSEFSYKGKVREAGDVLGTDSAEVHRAMELRPGTVQTVIEVDNNGEAAERYSVDTGEGRPLRGLTSREALKVLKRS